MKKERQIGARVGLPSFFALELEDVYRHTAGAHRAFAFPDFIGLLVGLGLEAYHKRTAPAARHEEAPEDIEEDSWDWFRERERNLSGRNVFENQEVICRE